jgi:predicted TIM-barrel fold metal-dependent hydrolase
LLTRRAFTLVTSSVFAGNLAGCGRIRRFFRPDVPHAAIDIHAHIFNGRDVPVIGFLRQVILRDPHTPPDRDILSEAFLTLLKSILLANTPTAAEELADLAGRNAPAPEDQLLARDERSVADGIAQFSRQAATSFSTAARSEANRILDRLAAEIGQPDLRTQLQTPEASARTLAAELFRRGAPGALVTGGTGEYLHQSAFIQTIRWAGLLTRPRYDILGALDRLYGGENQIRIFSPSFVDFGAWFLIDEPVTPLDEQIELTAAIARKFIGALILPFVAFCPLRAALEREDHPGRDPLRNVKHAVLNRGFLGVKLYPPMGFRPIDNNIDHLSWAPRSPRGGGAVLDRELVELYSWCVTNDVPIKAHANNSNAAAPGTGAFADPAGWRAVLDRTEFRSLRLNLAHFGGFGESAPAEALTSVGDWEDSLAEMVGLYPGLYFDLGYWSEAADPEASHRSRVLARVRELLQRDPKMLERMMYGSDWSMIGREPAHPAYLAGVQQALIDLGLDTAQIGRVMGGNAAAFLGLDRGGPQKTRIAAYYADHPIYKEYFSG